jgi:hemerythrin
MTDHLKIIQNVTNEHNALKGNIKLVGDTVTDHEATTTLQKLRSGWIPGQLDVLDTRLDNLKQALSRLKKGLDSHFAFEEKTFPPLLGDMLTKALLMEHTQIMKEMDSSQKLLSEVNFNGLSREEIIAKEMQIQQVISRLAAIVESHHEKEETVMELIRKALQQKDT